MGTYSFCVATVPKLGKSKTPSTGFPSQVFGPSLWWADRTYYYIMFLVMPLICNLLKGFSILQEFQNFVALPFHTAFPFYSSTAVITPKTFDTGACWLVGRSDTLRWIPLLHQLWSWLLLDRLVKIFRSKSGPLQLCHTSFVSERALNFRSDSTVGSWTSQYWQQRRGQAKMKVPDYAGRMFEVRGIIRAMWMTSSLKDIVFREILPSLPSYNVQSLLTNEALR